jgi:osmotically-inducible protein OsmY
MRGVPTILVVLMLGAVLSGGGGCAAVVVGGAAAGAIVLHDRRTTGTIVEDQGIELRAGERLRSDPALDAQTHINVTSYNQVVLLSGEAPTAELRERASELVRSDDKVRQVYNEIVIAAPSAMSARSSDSWITTKAKSALLSVDSLPDFDPTRVKVVTERGVVYLFGLLTRAEADAVTETVRRVGGVQRVVRLFEYTD